ncbi:CAP10 domain-containing protein [Mycena venus]|uniref:CAP10 domain-containing protein n=1 Tax=Mycena venus TaxID=2733690 RepID=A0A8H6Z2I8_9AGAR|nr:CAP10 domain-containing protein [Mycena venus]
MLNWLSFTFKPAHKIWDNGHAEELGELVPSDLEMGHRGRLWPARLNRNWPPCWYMFFVLTIVCLFATLNSSSFHDPTRIYHAPHYDHNTSAHARLDALFAQEHQCLIDEYHQISKDFAPFYQLAQDDPRYFKKMVDMGTAKVKKDGRGMTTGRFHTGSFTFTDRQRTLYRNDWYRTFARIAALVPDMNLIINERDEPRVMFDYRRPNIKQAVFNVTDPAPFEHAPQHTAAFFKDTMNCLVPNHPLGFTELANDASAFMLSSASTQFTTDLYPLLSMARISPCFADILVPSEFYYSDSPRWTPRYKYPNNIPWDAKMSRLYWRGKASGGQISGSNYRAFPRFRAVDIGRGRPDLMDVTISGFHKDLCGPDCDPTKIKAEYNINGKSARREEIYKYKYALDLDGNSFSGRYLGLLRSGSLVFKSTVFDEYFNDWLRPFEHYIPVLPDLSDLVQKIEWAIANDAEAHAIQEAGKAVADRVLTDAQNDCYFSAVMLEWAQLQSWGEGVSEGV